MQIYINVFRIFLIFVIPIFVISCSSSSYYERYGSNSKHTKNIKKTNTESESLSNVNIEDEIYKPPTNVTIREKELIIEKLSDVTNTNKKKQKFLEEIVSYLNTPYLYGGESRRGIDCSAFTQKVFRNSLEIKIPRTAREQYRTWEIFKNKNELKFGDLVYFNTSRRYFPGHVGIYLDNNLFAHASSSKGVIVSSLANSYYSSKFVGANRVKIK